MRAEQSAVEQRSSVLPARTQSGKDDLSGRTHRGPPHLAGREAHLLECAIKGVAFLAGGRDSHSIGIVLGSHSLRCRDDVVGCRITQFWKWTVEMKPSRFLANHSALFSHVGTAHDPHDLTVERSGMLCELVVDEDLLRCFINFTQKPGRTRRTPMLGAIGRHHQTDPVQVVARGVLRIGDVERIEKVYARLRRESKLSCFSGVEF